MTVLEIIGYSILTILVFIIIIILSRYYNNNKGIKESINNTNEIVINQNESSG